jgi:hypothetical protein
MQLLVGKKNFVKDQDMALGLNGSYVSQGTGRAVKLKEQQSTRVT